MKKQFLPLIVILLVGICQTGGAADLFYTGSIGIDSIRADVDLRDTGSVTLVYTLSNRGSAPETVTVEYWNTSIPLYIGNVPVQNPVLFRAGEQKSFVVRYGEVIRDLEPRTFRLDPTLLFNEAFAPVEAGEYTITLLLPSGVKALLTSNKEYQSQSTTGEGRVQYVWRFENDYPTALTVKWTSLGIDLAITKEISPQKITEQNRALRVEITVENRGEIRVDNLTLSDDFIPSDYEALEPGSEFFSPDLNRSDPRVIWRKHIGGLDPQKTTRAEYSITYIGNLSQSPVIHLPPTRAYQGGILVGVSNAVSLQPTIITAPGEEPSPPTTTSLTESLAIGALIVSGFLAFGRKRRG